MLICWLLQRAKVTTCTPMTTDLFMQWRKKKTEEKEAGLAVQRAERAKNDRMRFCSFHGLHFVCIFFVLCCWLNFFCISGRELFLADASVFVDDAEAYEKYQRQEPEAAEEKVIFSFCITHVIYLWWTGTSHFRSQQSFSMFLYILLVMF